MKKWLNRIDWILMMRLVMGGSMIIVGYQSADYIPAAVGTFFVIYSLFSAKYKVGCGYNTCGNYRDYKTGHKTKETTQVEYTEIK
mgnify:CR=1 FL=1|jgi:hypothetical protein